MHFPLVFLAHMSRRVVRREFFYLNDFFSFSKITELISTKFGRKHLWGMEIQVCKNQGAGTFWAP